MSKWNKSAGLPRPGTVVEFMHGDRRQIAWVLEEQSGKLRLFTVTGREVKLPAGRLLPWTGPAYQAGAGRTEMEQRLREHLDRRESLAGEVDVQEIWELAQEEATRAPVDFFAELVWESPDPDRLAAMGLALLQAKARFKFQPPEFEVHPREVVEQKERMMEIQRRREKAAQAGREVFKDLWSAACAKTEPDLSRVDPEASASLRETLLALLADPQDPEAAAIFAEAKKGLPDHPCLALILARTWGVVDEHFDPLPSQVGYQPGDAWAEAFGEDVRAVQQNFEQQRSRAETLDLDLISIDAAASTDRDDAFHVQRQQDGFFRVRIALARPTLGWPFGSDLDAEVAARMTSLYLPEGVSHMLPEGLGLKLFSLQAGQPRPVLLLDVLVDPDGVAASISASLEWAVVQRNMTYEQAEEAIAADPDSMLGQAHALAQALRRARISNGAVVIDRPDPDIRLEDTEHGLRVDVQLKPENPAAALAVSELMVLANQAAACWGRRQGVPLIHRTQDINLPDNLAGVWSDPVDIHQAVRYLAPAVAEVAPRPHASLGVEAYTPISSPLRRYVDFLNMAQVETRLLHGQPRLDSEQLAALLPRLNARAQEVQQIQRFRPRYWKLVHLRQNLDSPQPAILVDDSPQLCTFALPHLQIYVRAPRDLVGDKACPGQEHQLRFNRVDPLTNDIRVCEAAEGAC